MREREGEITPSESRLSRGEGGHRRVEVPSRAPAGIRCQLCCATQERGGRGIAARGLGVRRGMFELGRDLLVGLDGRRGAVPRPPFRRALGDRSPRPAPRGRGGVPARQHPGNTVERTREWRKSMRGPACNKPSTSAGASTPAPHPRCRAAFRTRSGSPVGSAAATSRNVCVSTGSVRIRRRKRAWRSRLIGYGVGSGSMPARWSGDNSRASSKSASGTSRRRRR